MLIQIYDLETTGLDTNTAEIIEIAWALYDPEAGRLVKAESHLIKPKEIISKEIEKIVGIKQETLEKHGNGIFEVLHAFYTDAVQCSYFVAHNGRDFDEPILTRIAEDQHFILPLIDTRTDLPWEVEPRCNKLTHLLADMGKLNTFAHSALADVYSTMMLIQSFKWADVLEHFRQPEIKVKALVDYNNRMKAQNAGFRWEANGKFWYKRLKVGKFDVEKEEWPFEYQVIS